MKNGTPTFFKHLRVKKRPTSQDIQQDLVDFHILKPGITEAAYGSVRTPEGKTSYEVLVEAAGDLKRKTVVDLACGNGPLTELIVRKFNDGCRVIGIDLCEEDLALARKRVASQHVEFRHEAAQHLSLPSHSVDMVLCHLAFMLFNPLDPVVAEMARILKPGGRFVGVVSGFEHEPPLFLEAVRLLKACVAQKYPSLTGFGWGDVRTHSADGLRSLFSMAAGFQSHIDIHHYTLLVKEKPAVLAKRLLAFFYSTDFLDDEGKEVLVDQWIELLARHADRAGEVALSFPLTRVVAERSS